MNVLDIACKYCEVDPQFIIGPSERFTCLACSSDHFIRYSIRANGMQQMWLNHRREMQQVVEQGVPIMQILGVI